MQEESGIFQITITDSGKKYIRKFAAISLIILLFSLLQNGFTIYWNVKTLIERANRTGAYVGYMGSSYFRTLPYIFIVSGISLIISNIYYIQFPRQLLRSINTNDEFGANESFGMIFKSALFLLLCLMISTASIIWSLLIR